MNRRKQGLNPGLNALDGDRIHVDHLPQQDARRVGASNHEVDPGIGDGLESVAGMALGGQHAPHDVAHDVADRGAIEAEPQSLLDSVIGEDEIHLHDSPGHYDDFLNSVATRTDPVAPIEAGHRSISVGLIGIIAMELGRPVRWDPAAEHFINDATANRKLLRAMRSPWGLS